MLLYTRVVIGNAAKFIEERKINAFDAARILFIALRATLCLVIKPALPVDITQDIKLCSQTFLHFSREAA